MEADRLEILRCKSSLAYFTLKTRDERMYRIQNSKTLAANPSLLNSSNPFFLLHDSPFTPNIPAPSKTSSFEDEGDPDIDENLFKNFG